MIYYAAVSSLCQVDRRRHEIAAIATPADFI
jgi:hypothetical protein